MKLKVVTLTDQPKHPGLAQLKRSLDHFGYDYHVITPDPYIWFGTKIIETTRYVRSIAEQYTHILFVDAHDVFFVAPEREIIEKTFSRRFGWVNTEKACWPDPHRADQYPETANRSEWKYLNSGVYLLPIPLFLRIVDENPIDHRDDDQRWFTNVYISGQYPDLLLDQNCRLFQSVAFRADDDFRVTADNRVYNNKTRTAPIVIHGNGGKGTAMDWVYELIP